MTDNERANKVYLARLKYGDGKPRKFIHELPLPPHDVSVGRKTPKSKRLLAIESKCIANKMCNSVGNRTKYFRLALDNLYNENALKMIDCYVGNK